MLWPFTSAHLCTQVYANVHKCAQGEQVSSAITWPSTPLNNGAAMRQLEPFEAWGGSYFNRGCCQSEATPKTDKKETNCPFYISQSVHTIQCTPVHRSNQCTLCAPCFPTLCRAGVNLRLSSHSRNILSPSVITKASLLGSISRWSGKLLWCCWAGCCQRVLCCSSPCHGWVVAQSASGAPPRIGNVPDCPPWLPLPQVVLAQAPLRYSPHWSLGPRAEPPDKWG